MKRPEWWRSGVVYQVYPRSFADTNSDGVGDLPGLTSNLDYLAWLGVDAVWLSPFYPSPMTDFGYDISDYRDVDPIFGTLSDFDEMLDEAHRRDIRIIVDLVPNHTSDEHPWFVESRSSRDNPKRDWYVWRDATTKATAETNANETQTGSPPNNWESIHGGQSAWEYDEATGQFYLHTFQVTQPDLDWHNPEVREAVYDVMRFWLERGVDGFRVDALPCVAKDELLRDNPYNPRWTDDMPLGMRQSRTRSEDSETMPEIIREMRSVVDEFEGDRVLIGEAYLPLERLMTYYGNDGNGLQLPYNFGLLEVSDWGAEAVKEAIRAYEDALPAGAGANWVLGNHDNPRVASRVGGERARTAQMLLLTLRGTPTCYYGDELGMEDVEIPSGAVRDPQGLQDPAYNRDPARTPMLWDETENAGFSTAKPWLPIDRKPGLSVSGQSEDERSMLSLFRRLISIRRERSSLRDGAIHLLDSPDGTLVYVRESDGGSGESTLVLLNFCDEDKTVELPENTGEVLLSTRMNEEETRHEGCKGTSLTLRPGEGLMLEMNPE